jgi:hypothetical protein
LRGGAEGQGAERNSQARAGSVVLLLCCCLSRSSRVAVASTLQRGCWRSWGEEREPAASVVDTVMHLGLLCSFTSIPPLPPPPPPHAARERGCHRCRRSVACVDPRWSWSPPPPVCYSPVYWRSPPRPVAAPSSPGQQGTRNIVVSFQLGPLALWSLGWNEPTHLERRCHVCPVVHAARRRRRHRHRRRTDGRVR